MLLLCALVAGSGSVWADPIISWSRSGTTDSYTNGYTFYANASAKSDYYQDASGTAGLKLYHTSNALFAKTPTSITFTAKVGGGTGNKDLSSNVYVCFVDKDGNAIANTETSVTDHITTNTGDTYNISMPTSNATSAYGVYIYHTKETGYNVRYYSFSLSAVVPDKTPIGTFSEISNMELAVGANQSFDASSYFTIDGDATGSATITVTPGEGDGTYAYYKDAKIYGTAYGTEEITVTATPASGDAEKYGTATMKFNVKVLKVPSFTGITNTSIEYGETHTVTVASAGAITVTSGNTNVATVSENVLTGVAVGTSTITVSSAKNDEYIAGETTFVLTVTAPEGGTTAKPATGNITLFHETFGNNSNSARAWSDDYSVKSGVETVYKGITSYTVSNAKQGKNTTGSTASGLNQSTSGTDAYIIIGPLNVKNYSDMTLAYKWKAASINGTYSTSAEYATSSTGNYSSLTLKDGTGVGATSFVNCEYSLPTQAQVEALYLKIIWNTSNTQGIIDEVDLSIPASPTETVKLSSSGYATFCSEYPLDFSDYDTADYSAWQITEVSGSAITFEQLTGKIKGGQGILLKGTADATVTLNSVDSNNELSENLLVGTLAPTYVAANEAYGLSGTNFVKINAGTINPGKAYLPASIVGPNASRLVFVFEDATGIAHVENSSQLMDDAVYNLSGQRVNNPKKGLYIVNGKKVIKN